MGAWAGSRDDTSCADMGQHGRCCKEESNLFLHNLVAAVFLKNKEIMTLMAEKTCCVCAHAHVCVEALAFILEPYLIQQAFNKGSIIEYRLIIWQRRERLRDGWARAHLTDET